MPRPMKDIIAHIRAVVANPSVSTTLIQTEDLSALCDAAEANIGALAQRLASAERAASAARGERVNDYATGYEAGRSDELRSIISEMTQ